jgi:hypothetical protein
MKPIKSTLMLFIVCIALMAGLVAGIANPADAGQLTVLVTVTEADTTSSSLSSGQTVYFPRPTSSLPYQYVDTKGYDNFRLEWDNTTANGGTDSVYVVLQGCSDLSNPTASSIWVPIDTMAVNSTAPTISESTGKVYKWVRYGVLWTQANAQDIHSHRLIGYKTNSD